MRKLSPLLVSLFILIASNNNVQAQNTNAAIIYMNDLTGAISEFKTETWQYLKAVTRGKGARKVDSKRQNLVTKVRTVKATIKRKTAFDGDASLKDAIYKYLELTYIVLTEDYAKILDMEDIAEQSYDQMEAYLLAKEKAGDKLDSAADMLNDAQDAFAAKHDITLIEGEDDKTAKKIKKAGAALKYYNELYLIFFKSYKQEAYVLDAQNRNDLNGLEQNINSLTTITAEQINKLRLIKSYSGDPNLKAAAQRMLTFYKNEANKTFPITVDYLVKKDNFEKVHKAFEAKSKKQRTQEDIDQFNKAVNEQNAAVEKLNTASESSNKLRSKNLAMWNKAVDAFFNKHSK